VNKICSGACFVMVWVLGLVSLLKLIIMVCQSYELCEYSTYGLKIKVSVIKFSHSKFVSVATVHRLFQPCGF
jgi:hypothetical protein